MPRNIPKTDRPALVRAGKILAEGLVATEGLRHAAALEAAAHLLDHSDWNRLCGTASELIVPSFEASNGDAGNVLLSCTPGTRIQAIAAAILLANSLAPGCRVILRPIDTLGEMRTLVPLLREGRKQNLSVVAVSSLRPERTTRAASDFLGTFIPGLCRAGLLFREGYSCLFDPAGVAARIAVNLGHVDYLDLNMARPGPGKGFPLPG